MSNGTADTLFADETSDADVTPAQEAAQEGTGETPTATAAGRQAVEQQAVKESKQSKPAPAGDKKSKQTAKAAPAQPAEPAVEQTDEEDAEPDVDELIYASWVSKQPVEVQEMLERQQKALRSALVDERTQRRSLHKQVKALEVKASTSTVTAEEVARLQGTLKEAQRQAKFYENLPGDCANPKLAFLAAKDMGFMTEGGTVNWDGLREQAPQLFARIVVPSANAGTGAKQGGATGEANMNAIIRTMTGRN